MQGATVTVNRDKEESPIRVGARVYRIAGGFKCLEHLLADLNLQPAGVIEDQHNIAAAQFND